MDFFFTISISPSASVGRLQSEPCISLIISVLCAIDSWQSNSWRAAGLSLTHYGEDCCCNKEEKLILAGPLGFGQL